MISTQQTYTQIYSETKYNITPTKSVMKHTQQPCRDIGTHAHTHQQKKTVFSLLVVNKLRESLINEKKNKK